MTTNGAGNDISSRTATNTLPKISSLSTEEIVLISAASLYIIAYLIAVLVCYCKICRRRNLHKTHRKGKDRERCELYKNSPIKRGRLTDASLETIVNRPLPQPPEMNRESAGTSTVTEGAYETPVTANSIWLNHLEEIRKLPPAPPVFPTYLERLLLDGEGAYISLISEDEAPLLSPGPMHEITQEQELCGPSEKYGYLVPKSLLETSVQQIVNETDRYTKQKEIKHEGNEHQIKLRSLVAYRGTVQKSPVISEKTVSFLEVSSVSSSTQKKTEMSNDTECRIFRSSIQLQLSPPTQNTST
jgi:hypothetical protein